MCTFPPTRLLAVPQKQRIAGQAGQPCQFPVCARASRIFASLRIRLGVGTLRNSCHLAASCLGTQGHPPGGVDAWLFLRVPLARRDP